MDDIRRIEEMEARMEQVRAALDALEAARGAMETLLDYYEGGQWRRDFEADEAGAFPATLRRGVLSEDGLYDLIADWERLCR